MSSLTGQESSNTQPKNPVNPGEDTAGTFKGDPSVPFKTSSSTDPAGLSASMDKSSYGQQNASGTSEQRRGEDVTQNTRQEYEGSSSVGTKTGSEDVTQNTRQEYEGSSSVGTKTGSESLIDSVERSVQEDSEGDRSGVDVGQVSSGR